jgi:hypothetical protein
VDVGCSILFLVACEQEFASPKANKAARKKELRASIKNKFIKGRELP